MQGAGERVLKDNFATTIRSRYFDSRDLEIGADEIVVVSCMRNEAQRLPYFLDYYRNLGVTRFLLVDNCSSDGTRQFLARQPDVEYFSTDTSYRGSSAGRLWTQELADTYATDRWTITVDVDELLVFPASEVMSLRDLCAYLDDNEQCGLFTVMLDMYSDRPLSQTRYEPGTDFLDTCRYFETDTYWLAPGSNPPFLSVFGGPRDRLFQANGEPGGRPMMKKIPLVKWRQGFSYMFSTHSHRFIQLSDVTGALLHFKFFDTFQSVAMEDAQRGDRRQQIHYSTYRETVEADVCFYGKQSRMFQGPADLVRMGVMRASQRYTNFVAAQLRSVGADTDGGTLLPEPVAAEGSLTLRSMAAIWPMVNNVAVAQYFGQVVRPPKNDRLALVQEMGRHIKVVDVQADHLLLRLGEPALHRWRRSQLGMSVHVGRHLVRNVLVDGSDDAFEVDVDSLEPGICRLSIDVAGAALIAGGDGASVTVTVYLFDGEDDLRLKAKPLSVGDTARPEDTLLYSRPWFPEGGLAVPALGFRGVIERLDDGRLRGWVYDVEQDTYDVSVCIYINGRLARQAWPSQRRFDIEEVRKAGSSSRGRGFLVDLPLGYFEGIGEDCATVEVRLAGRNLVLRRSPLVLPVMARNAKWDLDHKSWHIEDGDHQPGLLRQLMNGSPVSGAAPRWWARR